MCLSAFLFQISFDVDELLFFSQLCPSFYFLSFTSLFCVFIFWGYVRYLFSLSGVAFHATPGALKAVAQIALTKKTGARGLRTILEKVLMETMFVVPSNSDTSDETSTSSLATSGDVASSSSLSTTPSASSLAEEVSAITTTTNITNNKGAVTGVYLDAAAVRGDRAPILTRYPMTLDAFVAAVSAQQQHAAAAAGAGGGGGGDGWKSDCEAYAIALANGDSILPPGVELVRCLVTASFHFPCIINLSRDAFFFTILPSPNLIVLFCCDNRCAFSFWGALGDIS